MNILHKMTNLGAGLDNLQAKNVDSGLQHWPRRERVALRQQISIKLEQIEKQTARHYYLLQAIFYTGGAGA